MGQYYHPVLLDAAGKPKGKFTSHEYGNGLKLMEHSWLGNDFVHAVEVTLALDGPQRLVWAGDYADSEADSPEGWNLYRLAEELPTTRPNTAGLNSWDWIEAVEPTLEVPFEIDDEKHRYLVNHDRGEYVDKVAVPPDHTFGADDVMFIHPLPLLTCEGNGRGGGDFRGDERGLVGRWARDRISVTEHRPENLTELTFDLTES